MVDLFIKNAHVITMDEKRRIIEDGAIAIQGGSIVDIGETGALVDKYRPKAVIDAARKVAIPGLINTHMHIGYCLLKGVASDIADRLTWLSTVYPYVTLARPNECYQAALLGCLEMIKGGTTFFIENNPFISNINNTDSIAQAVAESGIRAAIGRMFSDINAPDFLLNSTQELEDEFQRLSDTWHGQADSRIAVWMYVPGPGMRESTQRMAEIMSLIHKYGTMVSSHWAEGGEGRGRKFYQDKYGVSNPTQFLMENDYLGPDTLLVHVVDLSEDEVALLAATNTKVSHCPTANLIRASLPLEISPVVSMLSAGITVGLGTDASICNDRSSMFEAMKEAVLQQKLKLGSPTALTAEMALAMATINGARVVGRDNELGSLEVGKKADIVLIDIHKPHILPLHNIYQNIVYCAGDSDVDTVIVNGKVLMAGRQVQTIDEPSVLARTVTMMQQLDEQARNKGPEIAAMWQESYRQRFGND